MTGKFIITFNGVVLAEGENVIEGVGKDDIICFQTKIGPEILIRPWPLNAVGNPDTLILDISQLAVVVSPEDICGFCGKPGADKIPHPVRWPGEESAGTDLVHSECEAEECKRAHSLLSEKQRESFLRSI